MKDPAFPEETRLAKKWGDRVWVYQPVHPKAGDDGFVLRARVRLEEKLGRRLEDCETIFFKDGHPENDDLENLEIRIWHSTATE